jgi:hypothetical protein
MIPHTCITDGVFFSFYGNGDGCFYLLRLRERKRRGESHTL